MAVAQISPVDMAIIRENPHPDHLVWIRWATRIGLILVVGGVVGEWRYGAKLEDAHSAVHQHDLEKMAEANERAGNAADSAKTAHNELDVMRREVGDATSQAKNLRRLQKEVEEAQLQIAMCSLT